MTKEKALVFISETEREMLLLKQCIETIGKRLSSLKEKASKEERAVYVESLAINLHSFYEGIETIFEKVMDFTGEEKPSGQEWHREVIERMTLPIKRLRPEVISVDTAKKLDSYRTFRHKIRHIYGFMIVTENVITIAEKAWESFESFERDVKNFISFAEEITNI
ncbi:MAG: hypothetical protein FJ242_05835 [Nitrospira sp.]|nr:hypothetical protein [Nitrospira sp.]